MAAKVYLAVDLGAESGRVMAGLWNGKKIALVEVHRFSNGSVHIRGTMRWDILRLWGEIQTGLKIAHQKFGRWIVSVGADTWGVDFVLLNRNDEILGFPYHYRDARTRGVMQKAFKKVSRKTIFEETGLQFLPFNSLYQLLAWQKSAPEILEMADCLLFIPDFLHWAMCGVKAAEFTIASTSQFLNPLTRNWSHALLKQFGLPTNLLPKIVDPATVLGRMKEILPGVKVVAPPSHDTASAVAGVPTLHTGKTNWAYISSGTWSLMGIEINGANLSPDALRFNMTNEGGLDGTYRLLKNIMGLWPLQQCKKVLDEGGKKFGYAELVKDALMVEPFRSVVNLSDNRFLNPPNMVQDLQEACRTSRQLIPRTPGELTRCCLESLALRYQTVLAELEQVNGQKMDIIHVVGGGSQNNLLNQFTADACQRPVTAGPVEATALGNLLTQMRADGEVNSLHEMRRVVRQSSMVKCFEPSPKTKGWSEAAPRIS